jgi:hypothetical protein
MKTLNKTIFQIQKLVRRGEVPEGLERVSGVSLSSGRTTTSVSASKLRDRGHRTLQLPLGYCRNGSTPIAEKAICKMNIEFQFS